MLGATNGQGFDMADIPSHVPQDLVHFCDFRSGLSSYPHEQLGELHHGPRIFYSPLSHQNRGANNKGAWVLTKAEDIRYVLQHPEIFSSAQPRAQAMGETWKLIPLEVDPPQHLNYRQLLNPLFSPAAVKLKQDAIRNLAGELVAAMAPRGSCDFVSEFSEIYPVSIFLELLGLPRSDLPKFRAWADTIVHSAEGRGPALLEVKDFLSELVAERSENLGEDLVSLITQFEIDGTRISREEMLGIVVMLFIGGLDTVVGSLGFQFRYLAENLDQQQLLRDSPELLPDAVEELFRAFAIVTTARVTTQDYEFQGVTLKKGDMVTASTMLSTRDPDEFSQPHDIDFSRSPNRHNAFSFGPHRCLGSHLARLEVTIAIEEWLARVPAFSVQSGAQIKAVGGGVLGLDCLPLQW
jgi:cytochrome P450